MNNREEPAGRVGAFSGADARPILDEAVATLRSEPTFVTTEGFGESKPVTSNATADERAQNRRVELRILGQ